MQIEHHYLSGDRLQEAQGHCTSKALSVQMICDQDQLPAAPELAALLDA